MIQTQTHVRMLVHVRVCVYNVSQSLALSVSVSHGRTLYKYMTELIEESSIAKRNKVFIFDVFDCIFMPSEEKTEDEVVLKLIQLIDNNKAIIPRKYDAYGGNLSTIILSGFFVILLLWFGL